MIDCELCTNNSTARNGKKEKLSKEKIKENRSQDRGGKV